MVLPRFLSLFDEFLPTFGAGNGDLALALGYTDGLLTLGAGVILMLPVLQPFQKIQIFPIFPMPLVGIAGQNTENHNAHQPIGQHHRHQVQPGVLQKHR